MKEQTMREVLCDCLGLIEHKIKNGSVTISDIRTMVDTLVSSVGVDATIKEVAGFYNTSEVNVRSLIKRRIMRKPKRRVYYDFREICRNVPKSWHAKASDSDK